MRNTRNILKFIVTIVIITGVLFSIETFLKTKLKSIKTGTIGKINAVIDHQIDDEIMIWGASTAYVNINPKILSDYLKCSVMNMGLDGTNLDQYSGLFLFHLVQVSHLEIVHQNGGILGHLHSHQVPVEIFEGHAVGQLFVQEEIIE